MHATPFSLVYGIEAILPIEFEIPSLFNVINERLDDLQTLKDKLE
jgi:hypothetical protein